MSQVVDTVLVKDRRTDISAEKVPHRVIYDGAIRSADQVFAADSFSSSQVNWLVNTPSPQTIVDRHFLVRFRVRCDTAVPTEKLFVDGTPQFAPRELPVSSVTDVLTLNLNGFQTSTNPSQYVHALMNYATTREGDDQIYSLAPTMKDQFQSYADWKLPREAGGLSRNPLTTYGNSSGMGMIPRGGFKAELIDGDSEGCEYIFTESLMISPLVDGQQNEMGFVNLDRIGVTLNFASSLARMFSVDSSEGTAPTGLNVSIVSQPELMLTFLTPNAQTESQIPDVAVLPFSFPQSYITQIPSVPSGSTTTAVTSNIQLSNIPSSLYLFARRSRATSDFTTSDTFARINNVNVRWDNQNGLLSSKTPQSLYKMCSANGSMQSWNQFKDYQGSILKIDFAKDIGVQLDSTIGSMGQYSLQVDCNITNTGVDARVYELYMIVISQGTIHIQEGSAWSTLGGISSQQVLQAEHAVEISENDPMLKGGSFFSDFKNGFNSVIHFATDAVKTVAPLVPMLLGAGSTSGGGTVGGASSQIITPSQVAGQLKAPTAKRRGRKSVLRA